MGERKTPTELAAELWGHWLLDLSLATPLRLDPEERERMAVDIAHLISADRDAERDRWSASHAKLVNERDAALARVAELEQKYASREWQRTAEAAVASAEKAEAEAGRLREREAVVLATLGEWRHGWATEYIDRLLAALDTALSAPKPEGRSRG